MFKDRVENGIVYLAVMENGREHNVLLDEITDDGWIIGKVAMQMTLTLYDEGKGQGLSLSVDRDHEVEQKFNGKDTYLHERCSVVVDSQPLYISLRNTCVLEKSWRPLIERDENGVPNEVQSVAVFPSLAQYQSPSGGFCTNPLAGPDLKALPTKTLKFPVQPAVEEVEEVKVEVEGEDNE